jgi:prepilin signal peptidase PulO-like enzyme (type II secretory pathway)
LPDKVVFPLIGVAVLDVVVNNVWLHGGGIMSVADAAVGAVTISGFFATLFFVSKGRWIGFGDVKLGIFMGFVLGAQRALFALVGSYYVGALVILPLLLLRKLSARSHIPFGPFLLIAFFISFFFTDYIIEWYRSLLG